MSDYSNLRSLVHKPYSQDNRVLAVVPTLYEKMQLHPATVGGNPFVSRYMTADDFRYDLQVTWKPSNPSSLKCIDIDSDDSSATVLLSTRAVGIPDFIITGNYMVFSSQSGRLSPDIHTLPTILGSLVDEANSYDFFDTLYSKIIQSRNT